MKKPMRHCQSSGIPFDVENRYRPSAEPIAAPPQ